MLKIYEVGGCVRDALLGIQSKDIDFAVEAPCFSAMKEQFMGEGIRVFQENPEFLTIRARFPQSHINSGLVADFVLCRKERGFSNARHPDEVEPGTIWDDLARRDFTVNAMARCLESGKLLDPHNGQQDLNSSILHCVGNADARFTEDALRVLRALRFSITKKLHIHSSVWDALQNPNLPPLLVSVSTDRKREELSKMFRADTLGAFRLIAELPQPLQEAIFADTALWLKPTTEQ